MKKLAFLLSLVLLLGLFAGCEQQAEPTESTEPSTTVPPPTEPASTQPPELEVPEFSVQTDYSRYTPGGTAPKFSRMQAGWMPNLVASEDYGMIYPFAGNAIYPSYEWSDTSAYYRYGMIDEMGRIIADATYDEICPMGITNVNQYGNFFDEDYLPLWKLMRIQSEEDASDSKMLYGFAASDGSFVIDCKYSGLTGSRDGYVLAEEKRSGGRIRFDLFDMEGNIVFRSEDLPVIKQEGLKLLAACYSEDRFLLVCRGKEQGSLVYYYTDWAGEELMGPYSMAAPFRDGYALAGLLPYETHAFIDKTGEIRLDLADYYFYRIHKGIYLAEKEDGHNLVIDHCGKILYSTTLEGEYDNVFFEDGRICHNCDGKSTYYDLEGNMLYGGEVPASWNSLGNGLFYTNKELFSNVGEKSYTPKNYINYAHSGFCYGLDYVVCESQGSRSTLLLNGDLEELAVYEQSKNDSWFIEDRLTGKNYLIIETANANWLYGEDPSAPVRLPAGTRFGVTIYGDRVRCQSHDLCAYYSLTGELLFSYPMGIFGTD